MFVVLLKFSERRDQAGQHMAGHRDWLKRGFDDGVFLLAGSLRPEQGGAIVAHNTSLAELQRRVDDDPFVAQEVVRAEILDVAPARCDQRLAFLQA